MLEEKVYNFITKNRFFLKSLYGLILLNVFSTILISYKEIKVDYGKFLEYFELFSVAIFSIEYLLRLWTANLEYTTGTGFTKRFRFFISPYGLIDLLAILPFYLPLIFPFDLRILRILRLFRLLRIFKLARLSKSMKTITSVLRETKSELSITVFVAFVLLILSSTLMYYFEGEAQPKKFGNIGEAMWWSVATLTTVGYGDVYPITGVGKFLSAIIALIGIGFIALPTGILSSAFIERVQLSRDKKKIEREICECPNCGARHEKNIL